MIYTIENERLKVEINSLGSEIWSIYDKKYDIQRLWNGDKTLWARRAPVIFPVCGPLNNGGKAIINGKEFHIPLHGFLRDYEHDLVEKHEDSITLCLKDNEQTRAMYPFSFDVDVEFKLDGSKLTHGYRIKNLSDENMPFSVGYHPGYMCPFDSSHSIEDYSIVFEENETIENLQTENNIIVGTSPFLENEKEKKLYDGFFKPNVVLRGLKSKNVSIVEKGSGRKLTVDFNGFPVLVLWGTMPVKFVCIEPWYGLFEPGLEDYGELKNKPEMQILEAGKEFRCAQSVEFN